MHKYEDLINIFNCCFFEKYNTLLVKGDDEPIYLPADEIHPHNRLFFAHGFFASALHESAHWLIAGKERRKQVDFGYWYVPDGRNTEQQNLFQIVEVKPQALEWILSVSAGHHFRISLDNLNAPATETRAFKIAVYEQVLHYCRNGLPERATMLRSALCDFYGTHHQLHCNDFSLEFLDAFK